MQSVFAHALLVCVTFASLLAFPQPLPGLPAPAPESGIPHLRVFTPKEIGGGPQVLVAAKGRDGRLYFNANRSVLEYDGARWRRVGSPTPRAMTVGPNGRVWIGSDGNLGYLDIDSPELELVSLSHQLPEADRPTELVRGVETTSSSTFFLYTHELIEWKDPGSELWRSDPAEAFEAMTSVEDRVFVYQQGHGLRIWPEAAAEPFVPLEGRVKSILFVGTGDPTDAGVDDLLVATEAGRIYQFRQGIAETFSAEAESWIAGARIWNLKRLADHRIAVATRGSGLLILRPDGSVEQTFRAADGLPSDEVLDVVEDDQNNLWLAMNGGIARLSGAPLTLFGPEGPDSLTTALRYDGSLYIGALSGAFRLRAPTEPRPAYFEKIDGITTSPWILVETPQGLMAGTSEGTFRIEGLNAEKVFSFGRAIHWHQDDGALWLADLPHLRIALPDSGDGWRVIEHLSVVPETIAEVVPDEAPRTAWLITAGSLTLYRVSFPGGYESPPHLQAYDLKAPWPRPLRIEGRLTFRTGAEVLVPELVGGSWHLVPDPAFRILDWIPPGEDRYGLKTLVNGELWLTLGGGLRHIQRAEDGTYYPGSRSLSLPFRLNFDVLPDAVEPIFWLATDEGPARFDPQFELPPDQKPLIRFVPPAQTEVKAFGDSDRPLEAPFSSGSYRFECALPFFRGETRNELRFRLLGLSERWSDWTTEPIKEFTNLGGGKYQFEVQARNGFQDLGVSSFAFRVLPPWYHTWWARGLLALGLASVGLLYVRSQKRKLERERFINQRLQSMDRLKDEFLANTSHELRTPLYGITGLAESLASGSLGDMSPEAESHLKMIVASGKRLSHLVNDILDFSKLRHGSLVLTLKPVDIRSVAEGVMTLAQPLVGNKSLELRNEVPNDLPAALADESRLQQILHNLMSNGIKFTDRGSVSIEAFSRAHELVITLRDTGIGIPASEQDRVFRAFEQVDASSEREHGGTGLGLAVTRRLVDLHGGRISVVSEIAQGSAFVFTLPIADESARSVAPRQIPPMEGTTPTPLLPFESWRSSAAELDVEPPKPRPESDSLDGIVEILVVDDEPINRQILLHYLSTDHYRPSLASSGAEALEMIAEQRFDLILLDVMMPKMSGYEVCRTLRKQYSIGELPIIFLTAKDLQEDQVKGLALGANDYLTKPISRDVLLSRIKPHLELAEIRGRLEEKVEDKRSQIKMLRGLLPICASCKKIRDDQGYWESVEGFIRRNSEANLTHGFCPDCAEDILKDL